MRYTDASNILYRCRDADGRLLYIGVTRDVANRMMNHRFSSREWVARVTTIDTEIFSGYDEAHAAEVKAIETEHPLFNRNHNQAVVKQTRFAPLHLLIELSLGRPLAEYVAEKRTAVPRWPWRLIATQLSIDTDGKVDVTHETLRTWYGTEVAA